MSLKITTQFDKPTAPLMDSQEQPQYVEVAPLVHKVIKPEPADTNEERQLVQMQLPPQTMLHVLQMKKK